MRIGFLACPETMPSTGPSSGERRGDAFEHDLQVAALRPDIEALGGELIEIEWRTPLEAFAAIDLVLIGTAWDYQDFPDEFLVKLEQLSASGIIVCNSPGMVRWNMDKTYLRGLAEQGARTIPTLWSDNPTQNDIVRAMEHFGCERLVVKRQVGAGGMGQHLFTRDALPDADWEMGHAAMMQPFLSAIQEEGELSFVFIDGAFSHAIQKTPATGEYRIQSLYGGKETAITPSAADIAAATAIVDAMRSAQSGETPLYARIDMLRADDGALMVMEAEAVEPYLYPLQGPDLGAKVARAIAARLGK